MTTPQPSIVPGPDQPYTLGNLMPAPAAPPSPPPADRTGAWVALAAGIAIVLGSFLPWASITAPLVGTYTVSGTDGTDGWLTAAVGVLLALYGGAALRRPLPTVLGVLAALAGVSVAGVALWKILDLQARVNEMRETMTAEGDELGIAARMADAVQVRIGVGLWLLIAAGLVAAAYTGYTLLRRR